MAQLRHTKNPENIQQQNTSCLLILYLILFLLVGHCELQFPGGHKNISSKIKLTKKGGGGFCLDEIFMLKLDEQGVKSTNTSIAEKIYNFNMSFPVF
jgi:hypothetical protein